MLYTSQHYMHKHKGAAISLRTELTVQQCFRVPKHTANPACCSRMPDYIRNTTKKADLCTALTQCSSLSSQLTEKVSILSACFSLCTAAQTQSCSPTKPKLLTRKSDQSIHAHIWPVINMHSCRERDRNVELHLRFEPDLTLTPGWSP